MKKYCMIAMALICCLGLSACKSNDVVTEMPSTMPTVITTLPSTATKPTEPSIPGTSFQPDDDGLIGETGSTATTGTPSR